MLVWGRIYIAYRKQNANNWAMHSFNVLFTLELSEEIRSIKIVVTYTTYQNRVAMVVLIHTYFCVIV